MKNGQSNYRVLVVPMTSSPGFLDPVHYYDAFSFALRQTLMLTGQIEWLTFETMPTLPKEDWVFHLDQLDDIGSYAEADIVLTAHWQQSGEAHELLSQSNGQLLSNNAVTSNALAGTLTLYLFDVKQQSLGVRDTMQGELYITATDAGETGLWLPGLRPWVNRFALLLASYLGLSTTGVASEGALLPLLPLSVEEYRHIAILSDVEALQANSDKIERYECIVQQLPNSWLAWYSFAATLQTAQQHQRALLCYEKAYQTLLNKPRQASEILKGTLLKIIGEVALQMEQYHTAVKVWSQAIVYLNDDAALVKRLAETAERIGLVEVAEKAYRQSIYLLPQLASSYQALAGMYGRMGLVDKALATYQLQLLLEPDNFWCHCDIANCYLEKQQEEKARAYLRHVCELDNQGEAGKYAKVVLTMALGENDDNPDTSGLEGLESLTQLEV